MSESCSELHQQVRVSRGQVEEARSALQAHRSRGQVLRALMEQKESGAIPGIHGRLVRNREKIYYLKMFSLKQKKFQRQFFFLLLSRVTLVLLMSSMT